MTALTGSSFVKSGADDTIVLLGAASTKPISEFVGAPTDLSNYYPKTLTYSQTEANSKFVRFEEVDAKLSSKMDSSTLGNLVNTIQNQTVNGSNTFSSNVSATGFAKTGKDDISVLLAGGGDRLLSSFGGIEDQSSSAFKGEAYIAGKKGMQGYTLQMVDPEAEGPLPEFATFYTNK
ncbi:MAG: hypothetical protein EZS28_027069 [Streblomastix strix]|uniref:Uncharacterized protein n=1 Tax=Streblomastix strix TaxID=222440 RepID=A0A5J4V4U1_9EUKA|nr:MAG: hypothetical protein EZS28_027069 [Streblomastix strix]